MGAVSVVLEESGVRGQGRGERACAAVIGQFDSCQKRWVSGKGRTAVWQAILPDAKAAGPQYLMAWDVYRGHVQEALEPKFVQM
jgi:hypothetical protein